MRKLTTPQKILISRAYLTSGNPTITNEVMTALEKMNDYETLWQDANRFVQDYSMLAYRYSQDLVSLQDITKFIKSFQ